MLIKQKFGNISSFEFDGHVIDMLPVEWYETNKRILHKHTKSGKAVVTRFLKESPDLNEGDILHIDKSCIIVVEIQPCEAIVIRPDSMYRMASLCYEIGNKHLPLFYEQHEVLVPYEAPLLKSLTQAGFEPVVQRRKLLNQLKSNVLPHTHKNSGPGLFSKIIQLTTPGADV